MGDEYVLTEHLVLIGRLCAAKPNQSAKSGKRHRSLLRKAIAPACVWWRRSPNPAWTRKAQPGQLEGLTHRPDDTAAGKALTTWFAPDSHQRDLPNVPGIKAMVLISPFHLFRTARLSQHSIGGCIDTLAGSELFGHDL